MKEFIKSLFDRRILIPVAIILLLGVFLGLYYFVYAPKQQAFFNKSAFRVLAHISENFQDRIENYSTAIVTGAIQKRYTQGETVNLSEGSLSIGQIKKLREPVKGDVNEDSIYAKKKLLRNDSIIFSIQNNNSPNQKDTGKTIKEILDPIVAIRNNIFESVVLFTGEKKGLQTLLYKSGDLTMDREIIADSLLKYPEAFLFPAIKDLEIEGVKYKLFLYAFRIDNGRYVLGGFLPQHDYKIFSQYFPLSYIISIGLIIIVALLSLPFLKIFLIGANENITLRDVRSVIAMLFVIPFLFILFLSAFWIYRTETNRSGLELRNLHNDVEQGFKQEISACLRQLIQYDEAYRHSDEQLLLSLNKKIALAATDTGPAIKMNLRDLFFYPSIYKNMDGVFWINDKGVEIEKWNYVNIVSPFLYLSGRQYFKNVKASTLDSMEVEEAIAKVSPAAEADSSYATSALKMGKEDSVKNVVLINRRSPLAAQQRFVKFTIQPTLSKATGNYTVNIVKPSSAIFNVDKTREERQAILIGISAKMYSVFNPITPKGFNFCIVNNAGDILFHSQSDRSLQENIFQETGNNPALRTAITNRDSALLNAILYDREVKMLVTPMEGLPFHLVTYYNKRMNYLFTFHVVAFAFLLEGLLLLGLSLFILAFYFATRKHSKLFFTPEGFDWIKPGAEKIPFYKTLINFQLVLLAVMLISLLFVSAEQRLNFIMQSSLLFPFSVATGYYMFRSAETVSKFRNKERSETDNQLQRLKEQKERITGESEHQAVSLQIGEMEKKAETFTNVQWWKDKYFNSYAKRIGKILGAYLCVLLFFMVVKNGIDERSAADPDQLIDLLLPFLLFFIPVVTAVAATRRYKQLLSPTDIPTSKNTTYLNYLSAALLLSVLLISILPTAGFVLFASHEEVSLQAKSAQMDIAKKVQEHRLFVNEKMTKAKYNTPHPVLRQQAYAYAKQLKFDKQYGIYSGDNEVTAIPSAPGVKDSLKFYNSVVYKRITDYLFLPADHFDFYNNTNDYFWTMEKEKRTLDGISTDELRLYFTNLGDQVNNESIMVTTDIPHSLPLIRRFDMADRLLFFFMIALFLFILHSLFISLTKRVFLIGYFEGRSAQEQDTSLVDSKFASFKLTEFERKFWKADTINLQLVREKEIECNSEGNDYAECVLKIQTLLTPHYEAIWKALDMNEKSVLYDFALDGFTNYRNISILFSLYQKSIIRKDRHHLRIMADSFRNYLVGKTGSGEIRSLEHTVSEGGKWGNLRAVFYIILFAIVLFLFITREDISKRVLTIVTALAAVIPLLLKLFDPFSPSKGEK